MNPILNLDELNNFEETARGSFAEKYAPVSEKIGAQKLSYSVTILQPGNKVCPFHNHRVNEEMFLILEGSGTLRFGADEYPLKVNDIIACPPGGREVAHQIINTSDAELRYLCLSTSESADVVEYPDSNKMLAYVKGDENSGFRHIARVEQAVDYFDGEQG